MKKSIFLLLICLSFISLTVMARPIISINPTRLDFTQKDAKQRNQFLTIKNVGDSTAYINIDVYNATEPFADQDQKATFKKDFGLIVSPRKLAIQPGKAKRIRITNLNKPLDTGRIYEVIAKTFERNNKTQGNVKITANILLSAQIYVQPKILKPALEDKILSNNTVELTNTGNVSINLRDVEVCEKNTCHTHVPLMLYPGKTDTITFKANDTKIVFTKFIADHSNERTSINLK